MNIQNNPDKEPRRTLLGKSAFTFACHENVPCFTHCCKNADMLLYPYDIIRLKHHLNMTSEEFLVTHTLTAFRDNPYFPSVMLKMSEASGRPCSFLSEKGCSVYTDRPYSCRAYPLEPAMSGDQKKITSIACYLVEHAHCMGHQQNEKWTAEQWMKDQDMTVYNEYNSAWARVAAFLYTKNTFKGKGVDNPVMNMAYMASYNMNTFRRFVFESSFLKKFKVPKARVNAVKNDDIALMLLGFDWILRFLGGQGPLMERKK